MSEFGRRRFDPSEIANGDPGSDGDAAATELLAVARDLEAFAASESVSPSVDFEDRVMAALANEPPPRALSAGGPAGLVTLARDAWRITWSGSRPLAVRAQALAFVLLAAVALGSVGALGVVGVGKFLTPAPPPPTVTPAPSVTPTPSLVPSPSPSPSVSPPPSPTPTPTPTASPMSRTAEPTETGDDSSGPGSGGTPRPTNDSSGPGSGSGSDSSGPGSGSGGDSSGPGSGGDSSNSGSGSGG